MAQITSNHRQLFLFGNASAGAIKRPKPTEPIALLINELPREASNQICPRDE